MNPLTIVSVKGEGYGVVLSRTSDAPYEEYRIQTVEFMEKPDGKQVWYPGIQGLFNRDELCPIEFCENDYLPGLILAAAGGYSHRYGNRVSCQ